MAKKTTRTAKKKAPSRKTKQATKVPSNRKPAVPASAPKLPAKSKKATLSIDAQTKPSEIKREAKRKETSKLANQVDRRGLLAQGGKKSIQANASARTRRRQGARDARG